MSNEVVNGPGVVHWAFTETLLLRFWRSQEQDHSSRPCTGSIHVYCIASASEFLKEKLWLMFEEVRQGWDRRGRWKLFPRHALTETNTEVTRSHRSTGT